MKIFFIIAMLFASSNAIAETYDDDLIRLFELRGVKDEK